MQQEYVNVLKSLIMEKVCGGCKFTELMAYVLNQLNYKNILEEERTLDSLESSKLINLINKMIKNDEIIEIEYILPNMNYWIKSFLLPPGTKIRLVDVKLPDKFKFRRPLIRSF